MRGPCLSGKQYLVFSNFVAPKNDAFAAFSRFAPGWSEVDRARDRRLAAYALAGLFISLFGPSTGWFDWRDRQSRKTAKAAQAREERNSGDRGQGHPTKETYYSDSGEGRDEHLCDHSKPIGFPLLSMSPSSTSISNENGTWSLASRARFPPGGLGGEWKPRAA